MQSIGLVLKRGEAQALTLGKEISDFLTQSGRTVLVEDTCKDLAADWNVTFTRDIADEADLLVVLGGDGTILRAAALMNDKPTPVLGVNLGRVGFMADVSPHEALQELQRALAGAALFAERMLLEVTPEGGKTARVLNDVVIHWSGIARLIDIGIKIGQAREIELRADGLIVSTPTGSSAYSYAANGPLIHPDIQGILLTPICPYAGLKRPLVVPPDLPIELSLKKGEQFSMTLDGHTTIGLAVGSWVKIVKARIPFVLAQSRGHDYIDVLREKLNLV
ncbi:MAG: NAD(+)/NADH kinase [Desulfomonilaceae bacterium]